MEVKEGEIINIHSDVLFFFLFFCFYRCSVSSALGTDCLISNSSNLV